MLAVVGAIVLAACSGDGTQGATTVPGATNAAGSGGGSTTGGGTSPATPTGPAASGTHTGSPTPRESAVPTESPVPVESNPPGDIPDSTQFVPYHSTAGGFEIRAPEGWARRTTPSQVTFTSKLNTISVSWRKTSMQPTVAAVKSTEIPQLARSNRAFQLVGVKSVSLPNGQAVQIDFRVNSEPNSVTAKQYRMDVLRFDFFKGGREASLDLISPVGSDNVDAWKLISESFQWR